MISYQSLLDVCVKQKLFKTHVANLFRARFPYLYISTWEEERAISSLRALATDMSLIKTPRDVFTWSQTTGIVGNGHTKKDETKAPLRALEFIEKYDEPAVFILKDFHIYFGGQGRAPDFQVIRKIRDVVPNLKQSSRPKNVVFISPTLTLPNDLQKDITIVDFDLPSFEEIKSVLDEMIFATWGTCFIVRCASLWSNLPS